MNFKDEMQQFQRRAWTEQLYRDYESIVYQHRLRLRKVLISIKEVSSYWGRWNPTLREISLSDKLLRQHPWWVVLEILKHEIAHQWVHEAAGSTDSGHGPSFHQAADLLGIAPWARQATGSIDQAIGPEARESDPQTVKIINRIAKLQALAGSSNENEAFLAVQRAKELKQKYAADLAASAAASINYKVICHRSKINPQHQVRLTSLLVEFYDVDVVYIDLYNAETTTTYKALELLGDQTSLEIAEYVYYFLWNQLPLLWKQYKKTAAPGANRRSYYMGVLTGLRRKLREEEQRQKAPGESAGLTLVSGDELTLERRSFVQKRFPRLRTDSRAGSALRDNKGFEAGLRSGRELSLRAGINDKNQQTKLLK